MKIKQLAKRIASELEADEEGERYLTMEREWVLEKKRGLRRVTVESLIDLKERVDRAVPDDFAYEMTFEDGRLGFMLEYNDGGFNGAAIPYPVSSRWSLLELAADLRAQDWNAQRSGMIRGSNELDAIADLAEDYPVEWIPTAVFHESCHKQIASYLTFLNEEGQPSGVLAADEDSKTLMNCKAESPEQQRFWISQQLGQGNWILAVVEDCQLLSPEATDSIRLAEIEKLPRIARAKAEGRFQAALDDFYQQSQV